MLLKEDDSEIPAFLVKSFMFIKNCSKIYVCWLDLRSFGSSVGWLVVRSIFGRSVGRSVCRL